MASSPLASHHPAYQQNACARRTYTIHAAYTLSQHTSNILHNPRLAWVRRTPYANGARSSVTALRPVKAFDVACGGANKCRPHLTKLDICCCDNSVTIERLYRPKVGTNRTPIDAMSYPNIESTCSQSRGCKTSDVVKYVRLGEPARARVSMFDLYRETGID